MKLFLIRKLAFGLILVFIANGLATTKTSAQTNTDNKIFGKIKLLSQNGDKVKETPVRVRFGTDAIEIESVSGETIFKSFKYEQIKNAEYSYTKHPRWKSGLGLGATAVIFPPVLLVAIPLGFTKHRRHWLTIKTENDYVVLQLSKSTRKIFMPAFESYSAIKIDALGEEK